MSNRKIVLGMGPDFFAALRVNEAIAGAESTMLGSGFVPAFLLRSPVVRSRGDDAGVLRTLSRGLNASL